MNTLKRYSCIFLAITLLFTSGFAPLITVTAIEVNALGSSGNEEQASLNEGNAPEADTDMDTTAPPDMDTGMDTTAPPDMDTGMDTTALPDMDTGMDTTAPPDVDTGMDTTAPPDVDTGMDTTAPPDVDTGMDTTAPPDVDTGMDTTAPPDVDTGMDTAAPPDVDTDMETANPPEEDIYTYSFKDNVIEVKAEISPDSVFSQDETEVSNAEIYLDADTTENDCFSELFEDYDGEALTVDLSFRTEDGETVEQLNGSTELTLTIPETDESAAIHNVEVYHYAPDGAIEQVAEIVVDSEARTVSFNADELGAYAVRYTVDFYFDGKEFHMVGGATLLLSELFRQLGIDRDAATVEQIDFTDNSLIQFTRYDDGVDWVIQSLAPFDTQETLTLIFADGERLVIPVTDAPERYSTSTNLADFLTNWKITVGDNVFTNDTVTADTVIEYKDGMQYSLELSFAEKPTLGFATPETNPPEMFYQLPDLFYVPDDFTVPLMVKLGRKGVLADNMVTVAEGSIVGGEIASDNEGDKLILGGTFTANPDAAGKTHKFLKLRWNWEDTVHWGYFRDSAQANLKIIANGVFGDTEPQVLSINGKDIAIRKEDLHNAIVNKDGSYNPETCVISYTVTVTSQGTVSDITLTDTLGSALTYQGDIEVSVNTTGTEPVITPKTGNTFNVVIPSMKDKDVLVFKYSATVDYDGIAVSGAPTFEETGNTAQISGDSYTVDNVATYHEKGIAFCDLEKNCINKQKRMIAGNLNYVLTWQIETNKKAPLYPLADTTITDTISPDIQEISKYTGSGVAVECFSADGTREDLRKLTWADLGVDLTKDVTWTYHIPDTDPPYRYVLTYDTIVDMSGQEETIVAENTAEGKGGRDSDRAVLPPPGPGGLGVTKKATNIGSKSVTWEITMTVSGDAFDLERLAMTEHSGSTTITGKDGKNRVTWSNNRLPCRTIPNDSSGTLYKEKLTKVEVVGLLDNETFMVRYGPVNYNQSQNRINYTYWDGEKEQEIYVLEYRPVEGENKVLEPEGGFISPDNATDYFQLEFFHKDSEQETVGNLTRPDSESASRTIVVRLTTAFSDEWATAAEKVSHGTAMNNSADFSHINWISVDAPGGQDGLLRPRVWDTDKFMNVPPHIYKLVTLNRDTTIENVASPDYYILNYPNPEYRPQKNPDGTYNEDIGDRDSFPDATSYPTFRYQVLVSGIQYDEPLVIEDEFDTSLLELITEEDITGGKYIMTQGARQWSHTYLPKVFGTTEYGRTPSAGMANFNDEEPNSVLYCFGYFNNGWYKDVTPEKGSIEKTETGFRMTLNELFKRQDGSLYPFYGIEYFLVPKDLESLKKIEQMALANGKAGKEYKVPFKNTATARGKSADAEVKMGVTNDFMPIDKTSRAWMELADLSRQEFKETTAANGQTVREAPTGIDPDMINRYVMSYRVVLNKGQEKLNEGNPITAEDEYSSNLSVDFNTIKITTKPEEAASKVSYDFSGNIGYFTIPDETKVVIEYEATILQNAASGEPFSVSNEVRMLQYRKGLEDYVRHGGAGGSTADNPGILVKKYGVGHMEKGLNGAKFQLYEYKHATYNRNESTNTANDWEKVMLLDPDFPLDETKSRPAIFKTGYLELNGKVYGDGYAEIELSKDKDGTTLETGKVYGLREIETPVGTAVNGEPIRYQNPHTDNFYCYVFSICSGGATADYANFVYLQDDIMTIRNTPESLSLNIQKRLSGNCTEILSAEELSNLKYQVFRKEIPPGNTTTNPTTPTDPTTPAEEPSPVYMPITMQTTENGEPVNVLDPHFTNIVYSQNSQSWDINGLTPGDYLLVEYGNDTITDAHPDWNWRGDYEWSDGTAGSFTNSAYQVYDENGQNAKTVRGIPFTVTAQEIKDGENKSVTMTNVYTRETVTLTAMKQWTEPSGAPIAWPSGKSVTFVLGTLDETGQFMAVPDISPITLDNKKDSEGEESPGSATFKNLPKKRVVDIASKTTEPFRYAVREIATVEGYQAVKGYNIVYPSQEADYAAFGTGTSVKIKNQMEATSVSVSKEWLKTTPPKATATFRLYSYTGDNRANAVWMSTVNDIILDGNPDSGEGDFGEKIEWRANFTGLPKYDSNGGLLKYLVREIACTPPRYEPIDEYVDADPESVGTITNRPAAVDFTVQKKWSGTPGDAWPEGVRITFQLLRKTKAGVKDDNFSADYVLSADKIVSQDAIVNNYGESDKLGTWSTDTHTLTVSSLPKYNESGEQWLYYATETEITRPKGTSDPSDASDRISVSDKYNQEYRDKNNYKMSGAFTYSGGSVTNALMSITVSKTVAGNMGDKNKEFSFTLKLNDSNLTGDVDCFKGITSGKPSDTTSCTVTFSNGEATFQLKHGEWMKVLLNLSKDQLYTVTENDESAEGYETTVTIDGWNPKSSRSASGTLGEHPVVAFVNRKDIIIPTGFSSNTPVWMCIAWLSWIVPLSLWVYRRRNMGYYTVQGQ